MKTLLIIADESSHALLKKTLLSQDDEVIVATDLSTVRRALIETELPAIVLFDSNQKVELVAVHREIRRKKTDFPLYMLALVDEDQLVDLMLMEGIDDCLRMPVYGYELEVRLKVAKKILDLQMELMNTQKELRYTARHDLMTGLLNHNEIIDELQRRLGLLGNRGNCVSIAMMDLDDFKHTNDTYGHLAGDEVLCQISQKLLNLTRPVDFVGRYGGDEFLIVLNNCNAEGVFQLAERIRVTVEEDLLQILGSKVDITMSFGVATVCQENENALDLISKADVALYEAKKDGGNKVRVAENRPSANSKIEGEDKNADRSTD